MTRQNVLIRRLGAADGGLRKEILGEALRISRIAAMAVFVTVLIVAPSAVFATCHFGLNSVGVFGYNGDPEFSKTVSFTASVDDTCSGNGLEVYWYVANNNTFYGGDEGTRAIVDGPHALVNGQNSTVIDNSMMESLGFGPGLYDVYCSIDYGPSEEHANWASWDAPRLDDGVAMRSSKTVHYSVTHFNMEKMPDPNYYPSYPFGQKLGAAGYHIFDRDYAPCGSGSFTVPILTTENPNQTVTGGFDIQYNRRGPYYVILEGKYPTSLYPYDADNCDKRQFLLIPEVPAFNVDGVTVSTGIGDIEPAYGDTATFHWTRTANEFHAQSLVILQQDPNGTIIDPNYDGLTYKIAEPAEKAEVPITGDGLEGYVTWPSEPLPEFPSGNLRVGVKYDDGYIEPSSAYVGVALSIYDAYTDKNAPLCIGDASEGKTSIYYKMSADAQAGGVHIDIDGATVDGTCNKGQNELIDAWDGKTVQGNDVSAGSHGLVFRVTPKDGFVGHSLLIDYITSPGSFVPALGQSATIGFNVHEPTVRSVATSAAITAIIYDSDGDFVRLLANGEEGAIDNRSPVTSGHHQLVWDGKNESQNVVAPGTYTVVVTAKDNAGVGCESPATMISVEVDDAPQTESVLYWPGDVDGLDLTTLPGIPGHTDAGAVRVSFDNWATYTQLPVDQDGTFYVNAPQTPGDYAIKLRTPPVRQFLQKDLTVTYRLDTPSISSPAAGSTFDPQTSGNVSVTYYSQLAEPVKMYVYNMFSQPACIDKANPVPAASVMNGDVSTNLVRTSSTINVAANNNTLYWDGKNDSNNYVPPGIYDIVVRRDNSDGKLDTEVDVPVVIQHVSGGPTISGITNNGARASISWSTDVTSTGCVLYEANGIPVGRVSDGTTATSHTVWLPSVQPSTAYDYYIIGTNSSTGATTVSPKKSLTTGTGPEIGMSSAQVKSQTEVDITYDASDSVVAAIEYARVGPDVTNVQWQRVKQDAAAVEHVFALTGLQPNSEYAYRVVSASNENWTASCATRFDDFVTKTSLPTVEIQDLANGQEVSSLSEVVVRASDVATKRFTTVGINRVEFYVDGEQVTTFSTAYTSDHVDYTFDLSGMSLTDGMHQIDAAAYDDYWQVAKAEIMVCLTSQAQQGLSLAVRTMTTQNQTSGWIKATRAAWVKELWCGTVQRKGTAGGHAFLRFSHPITHEMRWRGFGATNAILAAAFWKVPHESRVKDEEGWVDEVGEKGMTYLHYAIFGIKERELEKLWNITEYERIHSPNSPTLYKVYPSPPFNNNCVTWAEQTLWQAGIYPMSIWGWAFHSWHRLPWEMGDLTKEVNVARGWDW